MYVALRKQSGEDPRDVYNDKQALLAMQMDMQQQGRQQEKQEHQE